MTNERLSYNDWVEIIENNDVGVAAQLIVDRLEEAVDPEAVYIGGNAADRFYRLKRELDANQSDLPDHTDSSFLSMLMDTYEAVNDGMYERVSDE